MVGKKKKDNKRQVDLEKCKKVFNDYIDKNNEDKIIVNTLYSEIKEKYEELLSDNRLNIKLEKLRIEKSLGTFRVKTKENNEFNKMIGAIVITSMFAVSQKYFEVSIKGGGGFLIYLLMIIIFIWSMARDRAKEDDLESDLVNRISIIVLDELEIKYYK